LERNYRQSGTPAHPPATLRAVDAAEDSQAVEGWINFQVEQDEGQFMPSSRDQALSASADCALAIFAACKFFDVQNLHAPGQFVELLGAQTEDGLHGSLVSEHALKYLNAQMPASLVAYWQYLFPNTSNEAEGEKQNQTCEMMQHTGIKADGEMASRYLNAHQAHDILIQSSGMRQAVFIK
jgi:hypothetical protein